MTALFSIDCHACGAKNTIDAETMRRVEIVPAALLNHPALAEDWDSPEDRATWDGPQRVVHLGSPEPAGDSDWPEDAA